MKREIWLNKIYINIDELKNSVKTSEVKTSNTLMSGTIGDNIYLKQLNMQKIKRVYDGDYLDLWNENYKLLSNLITVNSMYGIIEDDAGNVYELSEKIAPEKFVCNGNCHKWKDIKKLYNHILDDINKSVKYRAETKTMLGFEAAIWNYTTDGKLFDIDPPRYLREGECAMFTRKGDENHYKRTLYRNFSEVGMKTNLLATIIIGMDEGGFYVANLPNSWLSELIEDMEKSFEDKEKGKALAKVILSVQEPKYEFNKHPIEYIRRKIEKNEKMHEEER